MFARLFTRRILSALCLLVTACAGSDSVAPTEVRTHDVALRASSTALAPASIKVTFSVGSSAVTSVDIGAPITATAAVLDQAGKPVSGVSICWKTSNSSIVRVPSCSTNTAVILTALAVGTANITAYIGGVTGVATLRVTSPVIAKITVQQVAVLSNQTATTPLELGNSSGLKATVTSSNGQTVPATVCWTTSSATVVAITGASCVSSTTFPTLQAKGVGSATLTAKVGAVSGTLSVSVTYPTAFADPVLLIHGLGSSATTWNVMAAELLQAGWREPYAPIVFTSTASSFSTPAFTVVPDKTRRSGMLFRVTFQRNTGLTFAQQGGMVSAAVAFIRKTTGATKVVLVGHSMGGLAARSYMQQKSLYKSDVSALITIGTPHIGSLLTYAVPSDLEDCAKKTAGAVGKALVNPLGTLVLSAVGVKALAPDSPEMVAINTSTTSSPYSALPTAPKFVSIVSTFTPNPNFTTCTDYKNWISSFSKVFATRYESHVSSSANPGYSANVMANWHDGVVPVVSQFIRSSPALPSSAKVDYMLINGFHTDETTDASVVKLVKTRAW